MTKQRLSQAKLQRYHLALNALVASLYDARQRFASCSKLSFRQFSGISRFVKELKALPHTSDYAPFEVQLKRRIVRLQHRLYGLPPAEGRDSYGIFDDVPAVYHPVFEQYAEAAHSLLRTLADVDIYRNHEPLKSVRDLI